MIKFSLREVAELVGIFSIVAGLMLVAYELRQNSQLMRAQIFNERITRGIEDFLAVAENRELSEIDAKPTEAGFPDDPTVYFEPDAIRKRQYAWFLRADRFRLENILYQQAIGVMEYDDGHLRGADNVLIVQLITRQPAQLDGTGRQS